MANRRLWMCLVAFACGVPLVWADPAPTSEVKPAAKAQPAVKDAKALAATIDQLVGALWKEEGVQVAPLSSDAEFLRRVYLDITGRIPQVQDVRKFLSDKNPNKREELIEDLLKRGTYVNHFATVWRAWMIPADSGNMNAQFFAQSFEPWLKTKLSANTSYDKMVRELLTANPQGGGQNSPFAFYQANENKPENLAAATSALFLGVKLQCAQCHKHPFARWTREQFWEYTAFFSNMQQFVPDATGRVPPPGNGREIRIPGTDKTVKAKFLDGSEPQWDKNGNPRVLLADWMLAPENPFFARAVANRMWGYFFGNGLVEPIDDLSDQNPPSHPELLDELAKQFVANGYDLKYLIRAITLSKAYQLTSAYSHESQNDPRLFARASIRAMSPEQLFDSIVEATRHEGTDSGARVGVLVGQTARGRAEFVARFSNPTEKATESQTSILQALLLMNGSVVQKAVSLNSDNNAMLASIVQFPLWDTSQKIETLYLATLSRKPTAKELERLVKYVDSGGPTKDSDKALADVFWALLNSGEFLFNH